MKTIDCLGEICPVPIMKVQKNMVDIQAGEVYKLITDHSCTYNNVKEFCKVHQLNYKADEVMNGVWEITIAANK